MATSKVNWTLTGSGGKKTYVIKPGSMTTITGFGGVGTGVNPADAVLAEVDILKFEGNELTAKNMFLTQQESDLLITFAGVGDTQVILKDFDLEDLENLSKSTGASVDIGNIMFDGQAEIQDSFDVIDANWNPLQVFNPNTVTFLNDLDNTTQGRDDSDDIINGQGGDDMMSGLSGNDLLRGGAGNDRLDGWAGNDRLDGEAGNDDLYGGLGNDKLHGGAGNDYLDGNGLSSDSGNGINDFLYGEDGNDTLIGRDGDDYLDGDNGDDYLDGDNGDDTLYGRVANDTLIGGDGIDYLFGNAGNDELFGGDLYDTLNGGSGDDFLFGEADNDQLNGGGGNDTLDGGVGIDFLFGNAGNDQVFGRANDDQLNGEDGNDTLDGGTSNDTLLGNNGNDVLIGGSSEDTLTGGSGSDQFVFDSLPSSDEGVDIITDFSSATDTIQIDADGFDDGLQPGAITADQFFLGSSAKDAQDRFIYNQDIRALFFDEDGKGGAAQFQFATLSNKPLINQLDIVVV